jgi:hypothetical protein
VANLPSGLGLTPPQETKLKIILATEGVQMGMGNQKHCGGWKIHSAKKEDVNYRKMHTARL